MYMIAMLLLLSNTAAHPISAPKPDNAAYAVSNPASEKGSLASAPLSSHHHHSHSGSTAE
jgi:hypothetical protein